MQISSRFTIGTHVLVMIALKGDDISSIPLEEVAGKLKLVTEDHDLVIQGRRMGICFG